MSVSVTLSYICVPGGLSGKISITLYYEEFLGGTYFTGAVRPHGWAYTEQIPRKLGILLPEAENGRHPA